MLLSLVVLSGFPGSPCCWWIAISHSTVCLLSILLNNDSSYLNLINKRLIFNAITIQWFLQNYIDRCVACNIFCSLKKRWNSRCWGGGKNNPWTQQWESCEKQWSCQVGRSQFYLSIKAVVKHLMSQETHYILGICDPWADSGDGLVCLSFEQTLGI